MLQLIKVNFDINWAELVWLIYTLTESSLQISLKNINNEHFVIIFGLKATLYSIINSTMHRNSVLNNRVNHWKRTDFTCYEMSCNPPYT